MFGSLMGDFEDDPIFGHHMRSMRHMNTMMNSMFSDPFGMFNPFEAMQQTQSALTGAANPMQQFQLQHRQQPHQQMMPFGFPSMPNHMTRLLSSGMPDGATSFSSSQIVSMTQGPDGRPQVYQASSSTKTGPGGIRETKKTVQDSRSGVKKMAIGHHIGERAHVIEREQNVRTGHEEERQDFINLEEEEADDFNREFTQRSRSMMSIGGRPNHHQNEQLAIAPPPSQSTSGSPAAIMPSPTTSSNKATKNDNSNNTVKNRRSSSNVPLATARRAIRTTSSPLTMTATTHSAAPTTLSIHPHPYNASSRRPNRPMKGSHSPQQQQQQQQQQLQQQQQQPHGSK